MDRRTWMACLGLLVAAGMGSAQTPPVPGIPMVPTEPAAPAAKPVAVVGDVAIGVAELEAVLKQSDPVPVHLSERQQTQNRVRALGTLIDAVLMRKFLEANTRPVDAAEVQRRLAEMEADLRKQDKSLAEFCQETRKTVDQVKADIADHVRWSAYEAAQLTDLKLMQFYNDNKDFFDGVTVQASHIVIRIPASATSAEKDAAREKLEGLRKQLQKDPKAFDEMAKSQPDEGKLGWIPRKWFDEQFSRAAFALPKDQVSEVVQTDFGLHLIKVTDKKPGKASEYAKIRESVREFCAQDLRQTILVQQRKKIEVKVGVP